MTAKRTFLTMNGAMGAALPLPLQPATRLRGIEGVRALAATAVVVYHVWLYGAPDGRSFELGPLSTFVMPHMALGVTLFFGLSGFLLYRPFVAALLRDTERPSFRAQLQNRALRILPAYWVILILVAVVLGAAIVPASAPGLQIGSLAGEPLLLLRSLLFLQNYSPQTVYMGIGPAWSLSVEVVFYLLLPGLVMVAWRFGRKRPDRGSRRLAALVPPMLLLMIGLGGKLVAALVTFPLPDTPADSSWRDVVVYSFVGQADLFCPGMVLAMIFTEMEDARSTLGKRGSLWLIGAAALIALPAVTVAGVGRLGPFAYQTLMAVACTLILAFVVLPSSEHTAGSRFRRVLESHWLVALGLVSYSLFLWHEPLVHFLRERRLTSGGPLGFILDLLLVASVSILLAMVTYRIVERPAQRRKRKSTVANGAERVPPPMPQEQAQAAP